MAVISTGCLSLDLALGIGGIPAGRVVEIYGPESSGKTTLALHVIAEAQKMGGVAAFIDAEHALDIVYARKLGVGPTTCSSPSPTPASRPWRSPRSWCAPTPWTCWWWTRWPPWCPAPEIEGDMGDAQMGSQARLMSQALRKLTGAISKSLHLA